MKKILIIFFLFLFNSSNAQYAKGSYVIGADLSASYTRDDYGSSYPDNLNLGATGSVFISDHAAAGLHLFESFNTTSDNPAPLSFSYQNKMYGAALFTKYYQKFNGRTGFVSGSSLSCQYGENVTPFETFFIYKNPQYSTLTKLNLTVGLYCFVYKTIAIEATYTVLTAQYAKQWNDEHLSLNQKVYAYEGYNITSGLPNNIQLGNLIFSVLCFFDKNNGHE